MTNTVLVHLLGTGADESASDADLLARYAGGDEAAFTELFRRHGRMVLSVSRRIVRDRHAADDVLQAVFLVLARKAGRLARPERLASWLFGVSRRVALRSVRLRRQEPPLPSDLPAPVSRPAEWDDLLRVLDDELARLPEAERVPLILCYLEGFTQDEAARVCGWSARTVRRRLVAGRDRLRLRLERRGVDLGAILAALAVGPTAALAGPVPHAADPVTGPVANMGRAELRLHGWSAIAGWSAGVVAFAALAVGAATQLRPEPLPVAPAPQAAVPPADPALPAGTVSRLGSTRFRHCAPIDLLAVSPDGKRLYARGGGWLSAFDAADGRLLFRVEAGQDRGSRVFGTLSVAADGVRIVNSDDKRPANERDSLAVLDPLAGRELSRTRVTAAPGTTAGAISPDGSRYVQSRADPDPAGMPGRQSPVCTLVDTATNKEIAVLGRSGPVAHFPDDGRTVIVQEFDVGIRAFDAATGKPTGEFRFGGENGKQLTTIRAYAYDMRLVIPTPDGKAVLFWGLDGEKAVLRVWDIGAKTARTLGEGDGPYAEDSVAVSPDGSRVATFRRHVGWTIRETATGKEVGRIPQPGTRQRAAFSPDGKTLYAHGDTSPAVTVLDVATGRAVQPEPDAQESITDLRFEGPGRLTALSGGFLATWDTATGRLIERRGPFPIGKPTTYPRWALSADGRRVFRFDSYGPVDLSDVGSGKVVWAKENPRLAFVRAEFDPTGRRVFAASDRSVVAFDAASGDILWTARAVTGGAPVGTALTVSPDGRAVVAAGGWSDTGKWRGPVWVFDAVTGKVLRSWETDGFQAGRLAFGPDGQTLYVAETDKEYRTYRIWGYHTESGKVTATLDLPPGSLFPRVMAVSPDGRTLTVTSDQRIRLFEPLTGGVRHTVDGHAGPVEAIWFRGDGRVLAAASPDAPVFLWDVYGTQSGRAALGDAGAHAKAWDDLADADAGAGFRAVRVFAAGADALPVLRDRMKAVRGPDMAAVGRWIADLGSEDFATRERASAALAEVARLVEPELRAARAASESPELRRRVDALLAAVRPAAEELRAVRAVEAVEAIGTPEAVRLLGDWAGGSAILAREAKAAAARLKAR